MKRLLFIVIMALAAASCSTTRRLAEGEYRLADNKVVVEGKNPSSSELEPYIKQKPNDYFIGGWNPLLYIYNLSSGKGTAWDKFVEKLGVAPVAFNPSLVENSKESMLSHLEYLGYYGSEIKSEVTTKGRNAKVTYTVTPGHRFVIDSLSYVIEEGPLRTLALRDSATSEIRPGKYLSESTLEAFSEEMTELFRNRGYYGFTKNYFFFTADTSRMDGTADLTVRLEDYTRNETPAAARPHIRYRFGKVDVRALSRFPIKRKFLDEINRIKPGMLYRERLVDNTYQRFSNLGLFNSVNIQLQERDSGYVDCNILLGVAKLQSIKLNLEGSTNSTGLFGITPSISYAHRNIFGGGESLTVGFRGNFQFKFHDSTSSEEYAVNGSLRFPRFLLLPSDLFITSVPQTEISALFNYQNRPEYKRNIASVGYNYNFTFRRRFIFQLSPLKFNLVHIYSIADDFYEKLRDPYLINAYRDHLDVGMGASFYYTSDPSLNPLNIRKTSFYTRLNLDVAGNILSMLNGILPENEYGSHLFLGLPYSQYVRGEVTAVQTWRFGRDDRYAFAVRGVSGLGYAYGNSISLPFEKFFYAGGASSMRGWQARSVGPGSAPIDSTFSIVNQTGDMHLEANMELRFPLFWKLQGGLFVDVGNIWKIKSDSEGEQQESVFHFNDFYRTTALDFGFGLRLDFNLILVRLDLGLKAYDPYTQKWCEPSQWLARNGYALHFGIGYPF
ncbi:MAG: BamA/TamA family outer membrane protein [Bacteroidales bacterium]|nr:BamA/TamA family outer membrane protein [Bacteroidales bacterium]